MGPCIVTKDELPNWEAIRIQSHVNGELRQDALVGEQIGPPPGRDRVALVDHHARAGRLPDRPGTPAGCGTFTNPPRFLEPGDTVTVSASGIGELTNPLSREPRAPRRDTTDGLCDDREVFGYSRHMTA